MHIDGTESRELKCTGDSFKQIGKKLYNLYTFENTGDDKTQFVIATEKALYRKSKLIVINFHEPETKNGFLLNCTESKIVDTNDGKRFKFKFESKVDYIMLTLVIYENTFQLDKLIKIVIKDQKTLENFEENENGMR